MNKSIILTLLVWKMLLNSGVAQQPITSQQLFFGGINSTSNVAYKTWFSKKGSFYDHSVFIPLASAPNNGAAIHWHIAQQKIYLAVAARAKGWVGFGLAEAGGMRGADIVYYTASTKKLVDAYVLDVVQNGPVADKCQNWKFRNSQSSGGFLIFEAYRDLNTGDHQDRSITYDGNPGNVPAHRIIAAWGDSNQISYHGATNRVRSAIRFYGKPDDKALFYARMKAQAEGSFVIKADNYQIQQQFTEYKHFCFSRSNLIALGAPANKPIQVIGWEPIVSKGTAAYIHHFVLQGNQNSYEELPYTGSSCERVYDFQVGYVWAPGEGPFALPVDVGAPYMSTAGFNSLRLEIHYNNPNLVANAVDNSGVRFYFTSKLRTNDMFVYQYGDPFVTLRGEPVGNVASSSSTLFQHVFTCPTACSSNTLSGPITVVREYLHMHKTGARIYNAQIRKGVVIRSGYIDFWDFAQQGSEAVVQQPFQVLPGDTFQTRCFYKPSATTLFGLASTEEMCIAFLFYYRPRTYGSPQRDACAYNYGFSPCEANYTRRTLKLTSDLGRVFGSPPTNCTVVT